MFCELEYADITCLQPELNNDADQLAAGVEESDCPPTKRVRLCSHCRCPGHTKTGGIPGGGITCGISCQSIDISVFIMVTCSVDECTNSFSSISPGLLLENLK